MPKPYPRKERLEELIALARRYRDWTDKQLALELGRNVHNLVPDSGVPKLDLVMRLAEALDWPVDIAVRELCDGPEPTSARVTDGRTAIELLRDGYAELNHGNRVRAAELAQLAHDRAADDQQTREHAVLLQCTCLDQLGHYTRALEVIRLALQRSDGSRHFGYLLRANLAGAHYLLGQYVEAAGIATAVISELQDVERTDARRLPLGIAFAVRGDCRRVRAGASAEGREETARAAISDLAIAESILDDHDTRGGLPRDSANARICRGGILEMEALLGLTAPRVALNRFLAELELPACPTDGERSPWIEALGWWCIFGSNVAMRHLTDPAELQRVMAILTNKADEIAEQLGHWALREHVWMLEHTRRRLSEYGESEVKPEWVLDSDDLRIVAGAIGRFPTFRETGWQILRSVRLVEDLS